MAVPVSETEAPIFQALNQQPFTLHLAFLNTIIPCPAMSIEEVIESSTSPLPGVICTNGNGTLSVGLPLPQQGITVRAVLSDIQLVGGVRVGLSGPESDCDVVHAARAELHSGVLQQFRSDTRPASNYSVNHDEDHQ